MIADRAFQIDEITELEKVWRSYTVKICFEPKSKSTGYPHYKKAQPNRMAKRMYYADGFSCNGDELFVENTALREVVDVKGRITEAKLAEIADRMESEFYSAAEKVVNHSYKKGDAVDLYGDQIVWIVKKL